MKLNLFASAKVNLALHIIGRRSDGYHILDSLVVFPNISDELTFENSKSTSLEICGPYMDGLINQKQTNIILSTVDKLSQAQQITNQGIAIQLTKNLPISSGIGGGSSNAAATLLALNQIWQCNLGNKELTRIAILIGADVAVCLTKKPSRIQGIGDKITKLSNFPSGAIVLANPNIPVSTPKVFANLNNFENSNLPKIPDNFSNFTNLVNWLSETQNDLEPTAIYLEPTIETVKTELQNLKNCEFARMSGSGATCFGLFRNFEDAKHASKTLKEKFPNWWVNVGEF